ncbi:MAG: membrane dipeptidase [Eubacteriales bacterium]|nr:membrane dipeptidase [Eubacteriales bacterium]
MFPIIDMHCDTVAVLNGWHASGKNGARRNTGLRENSLHVDLLRMKSAGYMCQSFALYTDLEEIKAAGETPFAHVLALSDTFDREVGKNSDLIRPAVSASQIEENFREGYLSALKTVEEGGVYEGSLDHLHELYRRGVRKSTLTWNYENELGFPNPPAKAAAVHVTPESRLDLVNGLTPVGISFVEEMERIGMLIDISHLNDAGIRDVFLHTRSDTPVIASHSNARGQAFHPRNLSDEMLRQIAERGGVCGINFYAAFLTEDRNVLSQSTGYQSRIEDMIAHIRYIEKTAGLDIIGLGTDFDGIGDRLEINGAGEMQKLADGMHRAGFSDDEIEKVFYKNVLRVYRTVLG